MGVSYHHDIVQGTEQWFDARRGILTASEMVRIVTPTLKIANNDKERAHLYELAAQRISGHTEPTYISDDMLRGHEEEIAARDLYAEHYAPVQEAGFITNDRLGFKMGYSPDALVGDDGLIEVKSRRQRFQIETAISGEIPTEHMIQVQAGLLVSERKWCDFISYSAGLPMVVIRAHALPDYQAAIMEAAIAFEARIAAAITTYYANVAKHGYKPTERRIEQEITL